MAGSSLKSLGVFVQFRIMSRTIRPDGVHTITRQGVKTPAMLGWAPLCTWVATAPAVAAGSVGGPWADGGAWPWLFISLSFVASAAAFFAWGHLRARFDQRSAAQPAPNPQPTPYAQPESAAAPERPLPASEQAWLEALAGAAILVTRQPSGLVLSCLNAAAKSLWPHAAAGVAIETLSGLTPGGGAVIDSLSPGQATNFDGWRFAVLNGHSGLAAQVLITQLAGAANEGDVFGSTLSHDLRAPIRVVEGFTRIVKEDYGAHLDRVGNDHLERVLGAAARMNLMIDALLTMARLSAQPLARQPVDLSQLAHFVVDDLRRGDGSVRDVDVSIEPGLRASGDPTLLRLVLENLLGNAWKYTARSDAPRIDMRAASHEGQPAFAVSDNGAGFDMRSADRLFGLFQRLHSANDFAGHGVGLASVRRIVRRHGGDIWAEGRPGQGATFTFTLG